MENQLSQLEQRIDDLLASVDERAAGEGEGEGKDGGKDEHDGQATDSHGGAGGLHRQGAMGGQ